MAVYFFGCKDEIDSEKKPEGKLQPFIEIDGSSSIFPIAQEISTSYAAIHPDIKISLSLSGTSNGFMKFCQGRLDMNNASRPIKQEEIDACHRNGVDFHEIKLGYDAVVLAVHKANTWCDSLNFEEIRKIWTKPSDGSVLMWSDINPKWPEREIHYYSPGKLSGTQDVFLSIVFGNQAQNIQSGSMSEDHNDVVSGISRDSLAIGYFSMPFLNANSQFVSPIAVDDLNENNGSGYHLPTIETIELKQYGVFSRPLYLYVNKMALLNPAYCNYLNYFLENVRNHSVNLGYAPLAPDEIKFQLLELQKACQNVQNMNR